MSCLFLFPFFGWFGKNFIFSLKPLVDTNSEKLKVTLIIFMWSWSKMGVAFY